MLHTAVLQYGYFCMGIVCFKLNLLILMVKSFAQTNECYPLLDGIFTNTELSGTTPISAYLIEARLLINWNKVGKRLDVC